MKNKDQQAPKVIYALENSETVWFRYVYVFCLKQLQGNMNLTLIKTFLDLNKNEVVVF